LLGNNFRDVYKSAAEGLTDKSVRFKMWEEVMRSIYGEFFLQSIHTLKELTWRLFQLCNRPLNTTK
jgi:hypothetical protein